MSAGENPADVLPRNFRLLNRDYEEGYMVFASQKRSPKMKINLDLYNNAITFINERKDTLVLKDDMAVKYILLGSTRYHHAPQQGYYKILSGDSVRSLAVKTELLRQNQGKKDEGYGGNTNGTSSTINVQMNNDVSFTRNTDYFIIDRGQIFPVSKSKIINTFRDHEDEVKSFIKEQRIDFKNEGDLIMLFNHALSLARGKG